jgi:hypothetical protein
MPLEKELSIQRRLVSYFGTGGFSQPISPLAAEAGIRVANLSAVTKLLLPSLFVSSLPKNAIGFSYPRGRRGLSIGIGLLALASIGFVSLAAGAPVAAALFLWLLGGSGAFLTYNSLGKGVAFVKPLCSTCRLLPIIEEHEAIHLSGVSSEVMCWDDAKRRYSYAGLGLADDPRICGFCPIAKRLRET